LYLERPHRSGP